MKKILRYLMMTVMAVCFFVPGFSTAEAASVALVPLVNNVEGDEIANQVFYKEAINALKVQKGFVLMDNDKITAAIEANSVKGQLPSESALQKIAVEGDVDIVIAMQLDVLDDEALRSSEGDRLKLDLQGYTVAYNRITGKFYKHRIYDDKIIPEVFSSRWDWTHEEWGRNVRIEIGKALKAK